MIKLFLSFLISLLISSTDCELKRVILKDPTALCLDGTPGVYYIQKGQDPKKIVLYFEGGGWCGDKDLSSTIQNCYQRSKTNYGSSKSYPPTITMNDGILSNNEKNSFRQATRVFLRYCDGSGHQGTRSAPIVYKDAKLYFRGNNITIAQLQDIQAKEGLFTQATQIIVTGGSAGGLAAFLWTDYIKQKASTPNVFAAPDSGIFLDSQTFDTHENLYSKQFQNLFKLSNLEINPPVADCVQAYPRTPYKCMMAQYMAKYIKTPVFAIQSLYDWWSIINILNIQCAQSQTLQNCSAEEIQYIQKYHSNTTEVLREIINKDGNGAWAPSCITHGFVHDGRLYSSKYRIPMNTNNSIDDTLINWIDKKSQNPVYIDEQPWPANKPCSGLPSLQIN